MNKFVDVLAQQPGLQQYGVATIIRLLKRSSIHYNTLKDAFTATYCNTLQHAATQTTTHHNAAPGGAAEQREVPRPNHGIAHCNTLQHTATHCNTLQHTATHSSSKPLQIYTLLFWRV